MCGQDPVVHRDRAVGSPHKAQGRKVEVDLETHDLEPRSQVPVDEPGMCSDVYAPHLAQMLAALEEGKLRTLDVDVEQVYPAVAPDHRIQQHWRGRRRVKRDVTPGKYLRLQSGIDCQDSRSHPAE